MDIHDYPWESMDRPWVSKDDPWIAIDNPLGGSEGRELELKSDLHAFPDQFDGFRGFWYRHSARKYIPDRLGCRQAPANLTKLLKTSILIIS